MRFAAVFAAIVAVAAASYDTGAVPAADSACSAVVTVTVTAPAVNHTPLAHTSHAATGPAPYPTGGVATPAVPVGSGIPTPVVPVPSGGPKPSGTGAYSAPPSQFTGAASNLKVGGALAAGAVVALFL